MELRFQLLHFGREQFQLFRQCASIDAAVPLGHNLIAPRLRQIDGGG